MSGLADRFRGDDGKEALLEALMGQSIVGGVRDLASAIAVCAEILDVAEHEAIITQDGQRSNPHRGARASSPAKTAS